MFLYRATTHVPLIVKMPGARAGGRRVTAPVQHVDLAPTVLAIVERTTGGLQGRSLLPVLENAGTLGPATIYSESLSPRYHFGWSELYALSDDRYRFIRAPQDELYDLAQDAKELTSIASDRPQVRSAMRSALDGIIARAGVTAPSAVSDVDRQKLAALGYVGTQSTVALQLAGDTLPDPKDKVEVLRTYRRAGRLAGARQYAEAAQLFRQLLKDDPGMTDVWLQLAEALNRQGQPNDALAAYKEVIARDPTNPAALTGATAALLRAGRIDEARAHAELAVSVAPAIAHEMLARIAVHQGDEVGARRHARLAQQSDPGLPMAAFVDGLILHRRGEYQPAADKFIDAKRAIAARTEQLADLNYYAADSLARLERYAEAEPLFNAEIALFPTHARAHAGLAMLYRATGRIPESDRAIAQLVRRNPSREGYAMAAQLWTMFGEPARAAAAQAEAGRIPK
jgi:tetratricopeptide (TPR) repeat protein